MLPPRGASSCFCLDIDSCESKFCGDVSIQAAMKLPADFEKTLAEKPAEELCEMLANAGDYLPEAIQAARAELGRRGLPKANVASMVQSATAKRIAQVTEYREKERQSLSWLIFHVGLLIGLGVLFYILKSPSQGR